jgi:thioredoxin-like negative regulator of GroEL
MGLTQNHIVLFILLLVFLYFLYKKYSENMDKISNPEQKSTQSSNLDNLDKPTLGVYYTEWCGYSRQFLDKLNNGLLDDLQNTGVNVKLVDCDKDKQTCADLGIQGFPTLLLHKNNKIIPYNGHREKNDILDFVKNN